MKMADGKVITETDIVKIVESGKQLVDHEDYYTAVDHFAKALEELVPRYGDVNHDLGHVYFYYGQALLGYAKEEADAVVQSMLPKVEGEAEEKKLEEVSEEVEEDEDDEEEEKEEVKGEEKEEVKEGDKKEEKKDVKDEEEKGEEKPEDEKMEEGDDKDDVEGESDGEEAEEPEDNLQLAWEVLEIAKKIFEEKEENDMLVETLYQLGMVSIENENFQAAIDDLILCETKHNQEKNIRRHAEIQFKLALAYSMDQKIDEAIEYLNKAADTLTLKIKQLKAEKTDEAIEKEIKELEGIITEINIKRTDVEAYKEEAHKSVLELLKSVTSAMSQEQGTSDAKSPNKLTPKKKEEGDKPAAPVNDISHLVRRNKRTSDEEIDADATPPKKPTVSHKNGA